MTVLEIQGDIGTDSILCFLRKKIKNRVTLVLTPPGVQLLKELNLNHMDLSALKTEDLFYYLDPLKDLYMDQGGEAERKLLADPQICVLLAI